MLYIGPAYVYEHMRVMFNLVILFLNKYSFYFGKDLLSNGRCEADVKKVFGFWSEIMDNEQMIAGLDKSRVEHRMPLCLFQ